MKRKVSLVGLLGISLGGNFFFTYAQSQAEIRRLLQHGQVGPASVTKGVKR